MIAIIVFAATIFALPLMSRLLVAAIATLLGLSLVIRSRRVAHDLLAGTDENRNLNYDRKPSRAGRRAMRKGLELALDQTELRSLFPVTIGQAEIWADQLAR